VIFRRTVFVFAVTGLGLAVIPTLIFVGDKGLDYLADQINIVADWAGL
jgi:hypothetical protein